MAVRSLALFAAIGVAFLALASCGKASKEISFPEREFDNPDLLPPAPGPDDKPISERPSVTRAQKSKEGRYSNDIIASAVSEMKFDGSPADDLGIGVITHLFEVITAVKDGQTSRSTRTANCTAAVLDNGDVITAAHCVDKTIREGNENCHDIVFRHERLEDFYRCDRVVWYSGKYAFGDNEKQHTGAVAPDVLVFRPQKPIPQTVRGLRLARKPADAMASLSAWIYTPFNAPRSSGQGEVTHFRYSDNGACPIDDFAPRGYPFRILSCRAVQGNSGGPIVNDQGEIQLIVKGFVKGEPGRMLVTDVSCLARTKSGYAWNTKTCDEFGRFFLAKDP